MHLRQNPGRHASLTRCEDSIGCMHGSSEPDLRNWISRLNLDEYNLLTVHT
ncbi:hypothetical protein [Bordetella pertussis]|uniref:hypothetical protein n=1 Tax=Bordetella pertussis TaxID=520 RepID=UPI000400BD10|nr:hypothetical protein [Bordetella pertussis]